MAWKIDCLQDRGEHRVEEEGGREGGERQGEGEGERERERERERCVVEDNKANNYNSRIHPI